MSTKGDRRALRMANKHAQRILDSLQQTETVGFVSIPELCTAVSNNPVELITFSCLGTYKRKQELILDLFQTFFFKRFFKEAKGLFESLDFKYRFSVIIPDFEPRRTWGWQVSQEEITECCRLMIDAAFSELPSQWEVVLWSDLEKRLAISYDQALEWSRSFANPLWVREEAEHMLRFPEISLLREAKEIAIRQIAAYAFEGKVLEQIFTSGILVQSDFPAKRKDRMYLPLRKSPLPIIHPFKLE